MAFSEELIPGLPNEIGLGILGRLPRRDHARSMELVSSAWRAAIRSPSVFHERIHLLCTEAWVYTALLCENENQRSTLAWFATTAHAEQTEKTAWWPLPSMPESHQTVHGFQTAVVGNLLYVIGGFEASSPISNRCEASDKVSVFDARTNRWSSAVGMSCARGNFACGVVDGLLYAAGGDGFLQVCADENGLAADNFEKSSSLRSAEVFNPVKGRWSSLPEMHHSKQLTLGTTASGKFLVSGFLSRDYLNFEEIVEMYDPKENKWAVADLEMLEGNDDGKNSEQGNKPCQEGGSEISKSSDCLMPAPLLGSMASFKLAWYRNELFILSDSMNLVCLRMGENGQTSWETQHRDMNHQKKGTPMFCQIIAV